MLHQIGPMLLVIIRAGLAINVSGGFPVSRENRWLYGNSEVTFLWRARENLPGKVDFFLFAVPDDFGPACFLWVAHGCCWNWACYFSAIASSHRGRHRKVRSRSRTEQRLRRHLSLKFGCFDLISLWNLSG